MRFWRSNRMCSTPSRCCESGRYRRASWRADRSRRSPSRRTLGPARGSSATPAERPPECRRRLSRSGAGRGAAAADHHHRADTAGQGLCSRLQPSVVYGTWPYPAYPPAYYPPPVGWGLGSALLTGMAFAGGVALIGSLWGWAGFGWGSGDINVNVNRAANIDSARAGDVGNRWQHNAAHRQGVAYRGDAVRNRFQGNRPDRTAARDQFRGRMQQADLGAGQRGGLGERGGVGDRGGLGERGGLGDRGSLGDRNALGARGGLGSDRGGLGDRARCWAHGSPRCGSGRPRRRCWTGCGRGTTNCR